MTPRLKLRGAATAALAIWSTLVVWSYQDIALGNVVGVDAQNFNATTSGLDFVTVQSSQTLAPCIFNLGLFGNYARNTLPPSRVVLLAAQERGYRSLMRLNSRAFLESPDSHAPFIKFDWLEGDTEGLIALTGGPQLALAIYLGFYASCLALTWWFYLRRSPQREGAPSLAEARV